jgi:transcriptional regulator with XRE-family HTH domain
MTDWFDLLYQEVMIEARKQQIRHQLSTEPTRNAQLLGHFLTAGLKRQGLTADDFAKLLGVRSSVAEFILNGDLPEWMLSDEFLIRAARVTGYEPNILRIMLDRKITPTRVDGDEADEAAL